MRRISGRAITRNRCLWKANQIVEELRVYVRNGGYQAFRKGDLSKINEALEALARLRRTALTKVEHESFRKQILRIRHHKPSAHRRVVNVVSTVEAALYQKLRDHNRRTIGWRPLRVEPDDQRVAKVLAEVARIGKRVALGTTESPLAPNVKQTRRSSTTKKDGSAGKHNVVGHRGRELARTIRHSEYRFLAACASAAQEKKLSEDYPVAPESMQEMVVACGGNLHWLMRDESRLKRFRKMLEGQGWQG